MSWDQIIITGVTLTLASCVQATIGFGAGMVSMPLLVLGGIPAHQAMGLILPNNIVQTGVNCWQTRQTLTFEHQGTILLLRGVGLGLGIMALAQIVEHVTLTRQVIGVGLIVALGAQSLHRPKPRPRISRRWTWISGLTSGFMAGLVMMGGPALVLWVMAHDWSTMRQRSFLWVQFLLAVPVHGAFLYFRFGSPMWEAFAWGIIFSPAGLIGAPIGGWLGNRLSPIMLRRAMTTMLVVIATWSIASPWIIPVSSYLGSTGAVPPNVPSPVRSRSHQALTNSAETDLRSTFRRAESHAWRTVVRPSIRE